LLFALGFFGIISAIPITSQLLASQSEPLPFSIAVAHIISVVQTSVLLLFMVWLGSVFSRKVGLTSPVIFALACSENAYKKLKPQILPALIGGVVIGILIMTISSVSSSYLSAEFLSAGENFTPPWYTRLLYGGITEEVLLRWGLMSFFVWAGYRLTQKNGSDIRIHNYIIAIIVSALLFGIGHLPAAFALSIL
jgi:membrane protease YdiL (CAAX protease family)